MPDRGGQPPPKGWENRFFEALLATGLVTEACKKAKCSRGYVYKMRKRDEAFAQRWEDVEERSTELLEQIAVRRAAEGSDQLMMFLLKARKPETYRENVHHDHSHTLEGTLTVQVDGMQPIQMDSGNRREAARLLLAGVGPNATPGDFIEAEARDVA